LPSGREVGERGLLQSTTRPDVAFSSMWITARIPARCRRHAPYIGRPGTSVRMIARRERGTGPNQLMEVSFKSWLVWTLALDDELLRAWSGPGTSPKRKPGGVTEPGFKEILVSTRQARGIPRCQRMSNNQIRSGPSEGLLTQRKTLMPSPKVGGSRPKPKRFVANLSRGCQPWTLTVAEKAGANLLRPLKLCGHVLGSRGLGRYLQMTTG
jgi:hypothetical protein